ncbi:MAG: sulfatase [Opitutaceae bacterium]|nr:sulfatase [Opitutaceae bacterium]
MRIDVTFGSMMALLASLVAGSAAARASAATPLRPNILFVMADDHAAHAISAYGSKLIQTPNIDRIAGEGILLTNCFATNAVCTPSRAAILSGKYSHKNGVSTFNTFDGAQWTVAKELQRAGWHTGMIGKWHLGGLPTGFDVWRILPGQGRYIDPVFLSPEGRVEIKGYVTDITTDLALQFLERRPRDKPFFLMYHQKAPHGPWQPDPRDEAAFAMREFTPPANFNDDYVGRSDSARTAKMRIADFTKQQLKAEPPRGLSPAEAKLWKFQRFMRDYLACVASVDRNLGRVLDYLDSHGLRENTLVIYTSDQGFFLGEHGWYDKRFMYEESLRMPFVARWPGVIKPGTRSDRFALNVDFAPTFLAAAGENAPADVQGRSLLPILRGEAPGDWRTTMYYRFYHTGHNQVSPHWGVRTDRYKLIYFNRLDQWELYDLQADPAEMKNLYLDPRCEGTVAALKTELTRLRAALDDRDQFSDIQRDNP